MENEAILTCFSSPVRYLTIAFQSIRIQQLQMLKTSSGTHCSIYHPLEVVAVQWISSCFV
jgi:hypothetical protein